MILAWVKGHAINVRMWGEPGNEASPYIFVKITTDVFISCSLIVLEGFLLAS